MHTLYEPCPLENGVFTSHHGPWALTVQVMSLEGIEQRQGQRLRRFCSLETLPVAAEAMPTDAVSRVLFASLGPNATRPSTVPMPLITRLRSRGLSAERLFQTPQPPRRGWTLQVCLLDGLSSCAQVGAPEVASSRASQDQRTHT